MYTFAVALFAGWVIWESWKVGVGSLERPGAGMWPLALAAALLIISAVLLLRSPSGERFTAQALRPISLVGMLFAFIGAYDYFGFLIPGAVLMTFQMKVLGREGWLTSLLVAVLGTGATFYLFSELLGANMKAF